MSKQPPRRVIQLFEAFARLPVREAWGCAADVFENTTDPVMEQLTVGGIVDVLPTSPSRSRRPDLARAGIDPETCLEDLTPEGRRAIAEALITGRALRLAVAA